MGRVRLLSIVQMLLGIFIQISALHVFGLNRFVPSLFVAALIPSALMFGPVYGLACGYIGGLIIDLLTGYGLGMSAIPFCIGGFLAGIFKEFINDEHYLSSTLFSIATIIIYDIFMFLALYFSRSVIVINFSLVFRSIVIIITTSGFSVLFHLWLHKSNDKHQRRRRINTGF
ncbi:MAG: rod shape-determining protein MreD [Eubacteriales bacterium]